MHYLTSVLFTLITTTLAQRGFPESGGENSGNSQPGGGSSGSSSGDCPSVWKEVASDLENTFQGCGDAARGAIRAPFHDCVTGACDGSLILGGECSRSENAGLVPTCDLLGQKAKQYNVGTADMIEFAAAIAISICPLGPRVRALVGRQDSSTPAPEGLVPASRDPIPKILGQFAKVGMSAGDVVAMVGAHTTARQFFDDPAKAGASLDTTPSRWDITFYRETKAGTAPYSLSSDLRMTNDSEVSSRSLM